MLLLCALVAGALIRVATAMREMPFATLGIRWGQQGARFATVNRPVNSNSIEISGGKASQSVTWHR